MEIVVNGEKKVYADGISLEEFVSQNGYDMAHIAIEVNEEIVPKANYAACKLGPSDKLEVVTFVGGG